MRFILFSKKIVGLFCEDPLKWMKANEVQFPNIRYLVHQILGIIGDQIKAKQIFYSVGILIGLYRCQLGALNLNKLVLISQNLPSDPHFSLEENANESHDNFGDCEAVGVGGIFFEDHLEDFVDFDNEAKIHLNMCNIYVWQLQLI
jgi:hypothetical protein